MKQSTILEDVLEGMKNSQIPLTQKELADVVLADLLWYYNDKLLTEIMDLQVELTSKQKEK